VVTFGHNRLKIIDLTDSANQPLWDQPGEVGVIFNGEIYNYIELRGELRAQGHEFRTDSDTEVIVEAFKCWGADSFGRLNGMFAFALFDKRDGRLWLVRDRFGVKPVYYAYHGDSLLFASTPGPISKALGSQPNLDYVSRGLRYWVYEDDSEISPYLDVLAVPAGSYVIASARRSGPPQAEVHRWYDFKARVTELRGELKSASDRELGSRFSDLLQESVSIRLRADVPVGISMSGGLDSTSIAHLMASTGAQPHAFSYGEPDDCTTEGPLVARTANELGIPVTYARLDERERVAAFWETLEAQGAPFPDTSIVAQYAVFRAAHQSNLKVLLGGQGADEALMGYRKFQVVLLREAVRGRNVSRALALAGGMSLMLRAELHRAGTYLRQRDRYMRRGGMRTAIRLPSPRPVDLLGEDGQPAWRRQIDDIRCFSLPTLLRYEDRNSTWNSLETRLPFLDFRVAELAVALPEALKVRRGYGKWILREAMMNRVRDNVRLARYKRGFDAPRGVWVSAGLGHSIRRRLRELGPAVQQWLPNDEGIDNLFSDDRLSRHPTAFAEATTLLWLGQHG
jgi:asparagine synthase (glutamine-hydrolysing)